MFDYESLEKFLEYEEIKKCQRKFNFIKRLKDSKLDQLQGLDLLIKFLNALEKEKQHCLDRFVIEYFKSNLNLYQNQFETIKPLLQDLLQRLKSSKRKNTTRTNTYVKSLHSQSEEFTEILRKVQNYIQNDFLVNLKKLESQQQQLVNNLTSIKVEICNIFGKLIENRTKQKKIIISNVSLKGFQNLIREEINRIKNNKDKQQLQNQNEGCKNIQDKQSLQNQNEGCNNNQEKGFELMNNAQIHQNREQNEKIDEEENKMQVQQSNQTITKTEVIQNKEDGKSLQCLNQESYNENSDSIYSNDLLPLEINLFLNQGSFNDF